MIVLLSNQDKCLAVGTAFNESWVNSCKPHIYGIRHMFLQKRRMCGCNHLINNFTRFHKSHKLDFELLSFISFPLNEA